MNQDHLALPHASSEGTTTFNPDRTPLPCHCETHLTRMRGANWVSLIKAPMSERHDKITYVKNQS